ncbi:MAG: 4Fe-4S cluster-binding domain-containing protein [Promethearchaeota archaeon]
MGIQVSSIVFDIKKFAIHESPGIRTTIFLRGCPLSCWWCHNPESQQLEPQKYLTGPNSQEIIGKTMNVAEVMNENLKDRIFYDESNGGVTFSGGESFMQLKYLAKLLDECKNESHKKYTEIDNQLILNNLVRFIEIHHNIHIRIPIYLT